jgi:hypothetical protein
MTFLAVGGVKYDSRIRRAELLALRYPYSGEIVQLYLHIAGFQKDFYESLPKLWGKRAIVPPDGKLRSEFHSGILLSKFERFLGLIELQAPGPLAARAEKIGNQTQNEWAKTLEEFWHYGLQESFVLGDNPEFQAIDPLQAFLSRAFLQPYAEFVASAMLPPVLPMAVCRCPRCNSLPLLGVLRPEGDGGKRFLQCPLCSQEWEFLRILCANCGETGEEKLPIYTAEQFPHIRLECCDTCKHYLRTIDLTKDGNAVPLVDDLAALPLAFWAKEHGYRRIQENLLGT